MPVLVSHSEAVNLELEKEFTIDQIKECLEKMEGCKVIDERKDARTRKDYKKPDEIRNKLEIMGIRLKDMENGTVWEQIE